MKSNKIAVAMSGGVDSSVAAAMAVEKYGKENVFGLTMKLFCYSGESVSERSCCSIDAINDAATVCKQLGIAHYVVNMEKEFESEIIDNFVTEYEHGRTPNPCVRCNSLIKFKYFLDKVQDLGANVLVTGHYAQITKKEGAYHLLKGKDTTKDQSYFIYNLNQEQMGYIWFPLGELTKVETRILAEKYALKTAQKTESQDICFVTTSTQEFLASKVKLKPGNIVGGAGNVLGKHDGLPLYTIGQRKGLGGGFTETLYVTGINVEKNELIVGKEQELYASELQVVDVSWTGEPLALPVNLDVKIRYNSEVSQATIYSSSEVENLRVKFKTSQKAITPGQTAVFYDGDEVVGGGIIALL